ncbi:MAG TPA: PEGA domain-containing protein [Armatimonadota bacterium]|nr:PEGA domain-containing protein [Armatimonadota bacterium]
MVRAYRGLALVCVVLTVAGLLSAPALAARARLLSVTTDPRGAEVRVDGRFVGYTPLANCHLPDSPTGRYTIRFELPAHRPATRTVELPPGGHAQLAAVRLRPLGPWTVDAEGPFPLRALSTRPAGWRDDSPWFDESPLPGTDLLYISSGWEARLQADVAGPDDCRALTKALAGLPVTWLTLEDSNVRDEDVGLFADLRELRGFVLDEVYDLKGAGLKALRRLPYLRAFGIDSFEESTSPTEVVEALRGLPITHLLLRMPALTDRDAVSAVEALPDLKWLSYDGEVTEAGRRALRAAHPGLTVDPMPSGYPYAYGFYRDWSSRL